MSEKYPLYCSFCGKGRHEVRQLIAGPTVFICDECIDLCRDIVDENLGVKKMIVDKTVENEIWATQFIATELITHSNMPTNSYAATDSVIATSVATARKIIAESRRQAQKEDHDENR